jgi:hypothetical protein
MGFIKKASQRKKGMKSKKIKSIALTAIANRAGDILLKFLDLSMAVLTKVLDALQK